MKELRPTLICFLSLACLGVGGWLIHPAVGLLIVGSLLWIDLTIWSLRK